MENPIPNFHPPYDNDLSNFPEFDDVTAASLDADTPFDFNFNFSDDDFSFIDTLLLQPEPEPLTSGLEEFNLQGGSGLFINSIGNGTATGVQFDVSPKIRVSDLTDEVNLRGDSGFDSGNSIGNDTDAGIQFDISPEIRVSDLTDEVNLQGDSRFDSGNSIGNDTVTGIQFGFSREIRVSDLNDGVDLRGDSRFDSGNSIDNDTVTGIQFDVSGKIRVFDLNDEINLGGDSRFDLGNSSSDVLIRHDNCGNDSVTQWDLSRKISDRNSDNDEDRRIESDSSRRISDRNSNDADCEISLDLSHKVSDQNSNNDDDKGIQLDLSRKISGQIRRNSCGSNDNDDEINFDLSWKMSDQNSRDNSNSGSITIDELKLKRKKEVEYDRVAEIRSNKIRRSNVNVENVGGGGDEEEKRKARNRESVHLSRQRKKQYVEELEDKVKSMASTISDLNNGIYYFMTENTNLRHQLFGGGGSGVANGMYPVYPMPGMAYPYMPYPPNYMVNPHGSKLPIPAPKVKNSSKGKTKMKKVASVSLFGLLFFLLLFGGLVPLVNVKYGDRSSVDQKGSVFMNYKHVGNTSDPQPLVASLYIPRNDKLVKIDGNLIIQSVLVSDKALGSNVSEETGLALHGSYPPYPTPGYGRQRALGSGTTDFTLIESDGKLPQWFREGLAGPLLSSSMCTEVFQFDISPTPRSILPAITNTTSENRLNYTRPTKTTNRRFLQGHAITLNTTKEHDGLHQTNKSRSSVVVSVLADPREIGEGVIGSKATLSRIFVVVLIDSVKYVTYSCGLPFMGPSSHLKQPEMRL